MKGALLTALLFAGTLACGSASDSNTAASKAPQHADGHHADGHADGHHAGGHHADGHHAGGHHDDGHHNVPADAAIVPPGEATVGDTTICPVSKKPFVVSESSPKAVHDGKTYYLCCGGCAGKFAENPEAFLTEESSS